MSMLDKNKIFFGLIHYILSEQKNVNWILKTSLIDFTGISSILEEKPYKKESLLDDVVDYVNSVKPYHVQFSHYFEHYETASELVKIPRNDKLETTINYRFDAIQSTPDINKLLYSDEKTFPSSSEYNIDDLEIVVDNQIYIRSRDDKNNWVWELSDEILYDGIYYFTKTKSYKTFKNNTLTNEFDKDAFTSSHMANRLFYMGIHDFDEIKKELNANFKGLEVNGHTFTIGEFGYELSNYETNEYDAPTIIYDYCFIDKKEEFPSNKFAGIHITNDFDNYIKTFKKTGEHRINLDAIDTSGKFIKVYRQYKNQEPREIDEYELKLNQQYGNYIEIYSGLSSQEKLFICLCDSLNSDVKDETEVSLSLSLYKAYVIVGYPFTESDSDILMRKFVDINSNDVYLDMPSSGLDTNKIVVQKQSVNGSKTALTNYKISNSQLVVSTTNFKVDEHIIITSFDYKYLYDKIYMWEDAYGRSNNIINLDGNEFLRARYESDRPRELVVSSPLSSCMIYNRFEDTDKIDIYYNDYKNNIKIGSYNCSQEVKIEDIEFDSSNTRIEGIKLENTNMFDDAPGKILVNSEIIEYKQIDTKNNILKSLSRGRDGSVLYSNVLYYDQTEQQNKIITHKIGDKVLPYSEQFWSEKEKDHKYITHVVKNPSQLIYDCPSGLNDKSYVSVSILEKISLLNDITEKSETIDINSYNVVPYYIQKKLQREITDTPYKATGDDTFVLKINGESIPFTTIYKDSLVENVYHIKGFTLPEKYKNYGDKVIYSTTDSYIHSCLPTEFKGYNVSITSYDAGYPIVEQNDELIVVKNDEATKTDLTIQITDYLYRIIDNILYDFKGTDIGIISSDNTVYGNDGSVIAKIIDDRFYNIKPIITLSNGLEKGTAIHIKIDSNNPTY